jgi:hypothetical protein
MATLAVKGAENSRMVLLAMIVLERKEGNQKENEKGKEELLRWITS